MKAYILLFTLLVACYSSGFSQATDSLKIVSMKKQLSGLQGNKRVDALTLLTEKIATSQMPGGWQAKADSVYHYATMAYTLSKQIGYKKGISYSLYSLARSEFFRGIHLRISGQDDSVSVRTAESYLNQAIATATELKNDEILGKSYYDLADILFARSKRRDFEVRREYLKKAIVHFKRAGMEALEAEACTWLCDDYSDKGYYEEGFEYCKRSMELAKKGLVLAKTKEEKEYRDYLVQQSLFNMANLYKAAGDYESAMAYLWQSRKFGMANKTGWEMESELAALFRLQEKYDSAFHYLDLYAKKNPQTIYLKELQAEVYLQTNEYDKALTLIEQALEDNTKTGNATSKERINLRLWLDLGQAYVGKKDYSRALPYLTKGVLAAKKWNVRPAIMQGYDLLAVVQHQLGRNDSAYLYLRQYTTLKDSLQNRQFIWRLNQYKKTGEDAKKKAQIELLGKENSLKEEKLRREQTIKWFLCAGIVAIVLLGIVIYRAISLKEKNEKLRRESLENELKAQQAQSEKKQALLQQQATRLEMQALRAQMNPHFIFNCLSSINRFILKNETEAAADYLTRFSRLIRMVLLHSQHTLISLEDELEMLRLYLDMERLRFKNAFGYEVTFINEVDTSSIFVPPLLLQPFCENAIWHGLMQKQEKGTLKITFSKETDYLRCVITDDGIGRQKASQYRSKSVENDKSLGLEITAERLALLSEKKGESSFYQITDLLDEEGHARGTQVMLQIRCMESPEEYLVEAGY